MSLPKYFECRLCGANLPAPVHERAQFAISAIGGADYEYRECNQCGTLTCEPTDRLGLYERSHDNTNYYEVKNGLLSYLKTMYMRVIAARIKKAATRHHAVLDFGCGSGELSNQLSCVFKVVTAYDVLPTRPRSLQAEIEYVSSQEELKSSAYDVIVMRHVLEHMERPITTLDYLLNCLNPDGVLIAEVPNGSSLGRKYMKSRWPGYFAPYHEVVFCKKSFEFLRKQGLSLKVRTVESPILGTYFMYFGLSRTLARILSVLLYPFQVSVNRIAGNGESLWVEIRK